MQLVHPVRMPAWAARQRGIIMIEVLVSIVILAVGILGLASLQGFSLRNSHSSFQRSIATDLAVDMTERIRANRSAKQGVVSGSSQAIDENGIAIPLAPDYGKLKCTVTSGAYTCINQTGYTEPTGTAGQSLAKSDVAQWLNLVAATLPSGGAVICRDSTPDDGASPVYDPSDGAYTTAAGSGCLATNDANYATTPYVIKIWWQDEPQRAGDTTTRPLTRFSTPL